MKHTRIPQHVIVIGAGIGGLTTATLLAQAGYAVTVFETNAYPGGSAGTFFHQGYQFDAGATVAGGFQANGPHTLLGQKLGLSWPVRQAQTAWTVHLADQTITLDPDRADLLAHFPASAPFWEEQTDIADRVWPMAADGVPWPPTSVMELRQLTETGLRHMPAALRLLPAFLGTTQAWLARYGLDAHPAFKRLIDALLLISAQTTADQANRLYSAIALDLPRQGVYHLGGGIGTLAEILVEKLQSLGGRIHYKHLVTRLEVKNGLATGVYFQRGKRAAQTEFMPADFVIGNLTPWNLDSLFAEASPPRLRREVAQRSPGWGAFVLYLGVRADALPPVSHHQIIPALTGLLGEGNSIFVSISPEWDRTRAPDGYRAVTITTHTAVEPWWHLLEHDRDAYEVRKQQYAERILRAVERQIPGFQDGITLQLPGSPVTYQAYTQRYRGMVGGFPQVSLLRARGPRTGVANVRLVGDSIFPGQSTAAVTLGGMRVADDVNRYLRAQQAHFLVRPGTPVRVAQS